VRGRGGEGKGGGKGKRREREKTEERAKEVKVHSEGHLKFSWVCYFKGFQMDEN
jgi:hypothetical protein